MARERVFTTQELTNFVRNNPGINRDNINQLAKQQLNQNLNFGEFKEVLKLVESLGGSTGDNDIEQKDLDYTDYTPTPYTEPEFDTYFDDLVAQAEEEYDSQRGSAQESYNTFIKHMKESRELFNKELERDYGAMLEDVNISVQERGARESEGLYGRAIGGVTEKKEYTQEQRDLQEKQEREIASQDLKERLAAIKRQEERTMLGYETAKSQSPYSNYSVL